MFISARIIRAAPRPLAPSSAPAGHLLPPGEKGRIRLPPGEREVGARRAIVTRNRRKWCALNRATAHKEALGVRVGALTNKAAHYRFDLVRTGQGTLQALTSTASAATDTICRERCGALLRVVGEVRIAAHTTVCRGGHSLRQNARTAHKNVGAAQENARFTQLFAAIFALGRLLRVILRAVRQTPHPRPLSRKGRGEACSRHPPLSTRHSALATSYWALLFEPYGEPLIGWPSGRGRPATV